MTWFLLYDQSSLMGLCMQDYKSLCGAVTIYATLVIIQTHRQTQRGRQLLTSLYEKLSQMS